MKYILPPGGMGEDAFYEQQWCYWNKLRKHNIQHFVLLCIFNLIIILHILLIILRELLQKYLSNENSSKLFHDIKSIAIRIIQFLTFGFYIRTILEIHQYYLISSLYEIYQFSIPELQGRYYICLHQ